MAEYFAVNAAEGDVARAVALRTAYGATAKIRLFKSGFAPTPSTPRATFVANESGFHGYAPITVAVWDPVFVDGSGQAVFSNATSLFFQNDDGTLPELVGGAWLETGGGSPTVEEYADFDPPIPMNTALAAINMEWIVRQPGPSIVSVDS